MKNSLSFGHSECNTVRNRPNLEELLCQGSKQEIREANRKSVKFFPLSKCGCNTVFILKIWTTQLFLQCIFLASILVKNSPLLFWF